MFNVEKISGTAVSGGKCKGPVCPDEHGNIVISGSHTGNIKNFWVVFRMGEYRHKSICAIGQYKDGDEAKHEFSFPAPRHGKYETYHGPGTLEFYLEPMSTLVLMPLEKPSLVIEIDEIVVESEDA